MVPKVRLGLPFPSDFPKILSSLYRPPLSLQLSDRQKQPQGVLPGLGLYLEFVVFLKTIST